jgi:hypothetical protein
MAMYQVYVYFSGPTSAARAKDPPMGSRALGDVNLGGCPWVGSSGGRVMSLLAGYTARHHSAKNKHESARWIIVTRIRRLMQSRGLRLL